MDEDFNIYHQGYYSVQASGTDVTVHTITLMFINVLTDDISINSLKHLSIWFAGNWIRHLRLQRSHYIKHFTAIT
jgi:hypothetical protein